MLRLVRCLALFAVLSVTVGCDGGFTLNVPGSGSGTPSAPSMDGQDGPLRVYFTRPEGDANEKQAIIRNLVGYIDAAKKTLDVCAFELDNHRVTDALENAVERGVNVRLVTETDYAHEHGVKALQSVGVPVVKDTRKGALMHNKFIVFDGKTVWTGSMNFTENCAYKNNNHGVFIDDARIAENYTTKFRWMFEKKKFGGTPSRSDKIPHPIVTLRDGTKVENYFSTHDEVAQKVMRTVQNARQSIDFLAFSFTHDGIGHAMMERASSRVPVAGVFEKSQAGNVKYTEYERMRKAGPNISVYIDGNKYNMHHKFIVVDQATTVAGSFNFSKSADESNDENVVIIHSPEIAQRFYSEFQYVYSVAKQADSAVSLAR